MPPIIRQRVRPEPPVGRFDFTKRGRRGLLILISNPIFLSTLVLSVK